MSAGGFVRSLGDYAGLLLVLVFLVALFGMTTEHFLSATSLRTMANQIPDAVIIAVAMTFVLIIGGIDLSVGSVLAFSGAVLGVAIARMGLPLPLAAAAGIAAGAACGMLNGAVITFWPVPSFIVTLGMLEAARGGAYLVTDSQTQYLGSGIDWLTDTAVGGISIPFLAAICLVLCAHVTLTATRFGRHLYALGANEETARLSGLSPARLRFAVFTLSGALTGIAAVIHCARLSAADPNSGIGYELQAIAAVVIGGTSLMGGRGSVLKSFIGVLIIAVLETGLAQIGAQDPTKRLVTGGVIVSAVIIDYYRHRMRGTA